MLHNAIRLATSVLPIVEADIPTLEVHDCYLVCGPERTARILRFIARQPLDIRLRLWRKYSQREIATVVDALAERQARIERAILTAKRSIVRSYNMWPINGAFDVPKGYLETGRYSTSDGPRAILEGPLPVWTAIRMAEIKAGREASAQIDPRF